MAGEYPTVTMNIKRRWFADILAQPCRHPLEYREIKPFWDRRLAGLIGSRFKLRLLNGMLRPVPEATIMVEKLVRNSRNGEWELHLGRVLEVKHWNRKSERPLR